jgi:hypothetical protein
MMPAVRMKAEVQAEVRRFEELLDFVDAGCKADDGVRKP